ncbi:MAG TPA: hypothetical protein VE842_13825 [Pyrinomonadaceae bacterium]|nr:hypothetical protein [Pyrinomonadaceae bacterium]
MSSILRLINREETEEDDPALLEYLVVHATDHLRVFQSRVTATKEPSEVSPDEHEAFSIDLDYLRPQEAHESHAENIHPYLWQPFVTPII